MSPDASTIVQERRLISTIRTRASPDASTIVQERHLIPTIRSKAPRRRRTCRTEIISLLQFCSVKCRFGMLILTDSRLPLSIFVPFWYFDFNGFALSAVTPEVPKPMARLSRKLFRMHMPDVVARKCVTILHDYIRSPQRLHSAKLIPL